MLFDSEKSLILNNISVRKVHDKVASVIFSQGREFLLHGMTPLRMFIGLTVGFGFLQ
jgi:hypothetical protein